MKKNMLIAQSGGPTAAINATVAGVVSAAYVSQKVDRILGAVNGIQGVLDEKFIDIKANIKNMGDLENLCQTPAAALGSCRMKLSDFETDASQFERIIAIFKKYSISYFVYIGGNDSMDTVDKLSRYCKSVGLDHIVIVGAPKTIDNDLAETDHCPGFGSAAKYLGTTFAELERDCHVYATKAVTIVEVMGRNAGWLTAASALSRVNGGKGPNLIYLCERVFDCEQFINDVQKELEVNNSVLVAISEGIKNEDGTYISEAFQTGDVDTFGHSQIAGSAKVLEQLVRERIGCKVRSIELSLMQRCAGHITSETDIMESKMLGMKACQCAIEGESGKMVTIIRRSNHPYEVEFSVIPVSRVSNKEKHVPDDYINLAGNDITEKMMNYLLPLIQGEYTAVYKNGIPDYKILY
jgi:6-phosphofructokinase